MIRPALLITVALAGGCSLGLERDAPQRARFLIDARRAERSAAAGGGTVLEVGRFHATSAYATSEFVYRRSDHAYQSDYYRGFLVAPELAIGDATRQWLADAGIASAVVDTGGLVLPTHTLEGDVTALYGDFRSAPAAVLELRIALVDKRSGRALLQRSYAEREPLDAAADGAAEALPAAWSKALARVLTQVEADLRGALDG